jgi:hypothetical protein
MTIVRNEEQKVDDLMVTGIDIMKNCEKQTGKKLGRYISIDTSELILDSADKLEQTHEVFSDEVQKLIYEILKMTQHA